MAIPDGNVLTDLMTQFLTLMKPSYKNVRPFAMYLLFTLVTIDILIAGIIITISGASDITETCIKKALKVGAFIFMVMLFPNIIEAFQKSFIQIGFIAAGKTIDINLFTNPSAISQMGIDMISPLVENLSLTSMTGNNIINGATAGSNAVGGAGGSIVGGAIGAVGGTIKSLATSVMLGLTYIMILFCFFAIAINLFVIYIEFAIFTSIALILIPFGAWDQTAFIFEKAKNGIINYGIKLMVLAFILSISFGMIKQWQLPPEPTFQQALYVLLGMLAITYLSWHAPMIASGMASGSGGAMTGAALGGFAGSIAGKAASAGGGVQNAVVGSKQKIGTDLATGKDMHQRGGIVPTLGRMTGITPKIETAIDATKSAIKKPFSKSASPSPAPASGVDLNPPETPNTNPSND